MIFISYLDYRFWFPLSCTRLFPRMHPFHCLICSQHMHAHVRALHMPHMPQNMIQQLYHYIDTISDNPGMTGIISALHHPQSWPDTQSLPPHDHQTGKGLGPSLMALFAFADLHTIFLLPVSRRLVKSVLPG